MCEYFQYMTPNFFFTLSGRADNSFFLNIFGEFIKINTRHNINYNINFILNGCTACCYDKYFNIVQGFNHHCHHPRLHYQFFFLHHSDTTKRLYASGQLYFYYRSPSKHFMWWQYFQSLSRWSFKKTLF